MTAPCWLCSGMPPERANESCYVTFGLMLLQGLTLIPLLSGLSILGWLNLRAAVALRFADAARAVTNIDKKKPTVCIV